MEKKRLYLVQHGEATSKEINPDRPLTEKGRHNSAKTAQFLKTSGINVNLIWHSTKLRAIETAQIFNKILIPNNGVEQKEGLSPNDPPDELFAAITPQKKHIMLVGHLPFLQRLASLILFDTPDYEIIKFSMGGAVALEQGEDRKWKIIFEIIPDLL